jgi:hypothetical protein
VPRSGEQPLGRVLFVDCVKLGFGIPNAEIGPFWQCMLVLSVLNNNILDELERHIDPIDGFCDDVNHVAFHNQIISKSSQHKSSTSKMQAATLNAILGDSNDRGYACRSVTTIAALNAVYAQLNSKLAAANTNIIHLHDMLAEAEIHRDELLDAGHAYELNALDATNQGLHDHEVWALNFSCTRRRISTSSRKRCSRFPSISASRCTTRSSVISARNLSAAPTDTPGKTVPKHLSEQRA